MGGENGGGEKTGGKTERQASGGSNNFYMKMTLDHNICISA